MRPADGSAMRHKSKYSQYRHASGSHNCDYKFVTHQSLWCITLKCKILSPNSHNAEIFLHKLWRPNCFFNLRSSYLISVLDSSSRFIWIPMLCVYGHYLFYFFIAGTVFRRQNLTSNDVPALKGLIYIHCTCIFKYGCDRMWLENITVWDEMCVMRKRQSVLCCIVVAIMCRK